MRTLAAMLLCAVCASSAMAGLFNTSQPKYDPCVCPTKTGHYEAAKKKQIGKISGPAKLVDDEHAVHTVVLLPKHYNSCHPCLRVLKAFNSDRELIEIRRETTYWVIVEGTPDFEERGWATRYPEVRRGQTVVVMVQGNRQIAKLVSPNTIGLGGILKKKLCDKFCPPQTTPPPEEPVVDPEPEPDTTIVPTPDPPQPTAHTEVNPLMMAITVIGVGLVVWLAMFQRGMG